VIAVKAQPCREKEDVPHPRALEAVAYLDPLLVSPAVEVVQRVRADRAFSRGAPPPEEPREYWDLEIPLIYVCLENVARVEGRHATGLVGYRAVELAVEEVVHAIPLHQLLV
jgi:hypothetical protein